MDYFKIRKVLIVFVIIINSILCINIYNMFNGAKQERDKIIKQNIQTLEQRGIFIDENLYLEMLQIAPSYTYETYITEYIVEGILGEIKSSENNLYISDNGTASILNDGNFTISLNKAYTFLEIEEMLEKSSFVSIKYSAEYDENVATYTFKINDKSVFNCSFKVILSSSNTLIQGNWVFANNQPVEEFNEYSLLQTLLTLNDEIFVSGEILDINLVYKLEGVQIPKFVPLYEIVFKEKTILYDIYSDVVVNTYINIKKLWFYVYYML